MACAVGIFERHDHSIKAGLLSGKRFEAARREPRETMRDRNVVGKDDQWALGANNCSGQIKDQHVGPWLLGTTHFDARKTELDHMPGKIA